MVEDFSLASVKIERRPIDIETALRCDPLGISSSEILPSATVHLGCTCHDRLIERPLDTLTKQAQTTFRSLSCAYR